MRIEGSRRYDVPVGQGFAFVTDMANWSKFWPGFVRLEPESTWGAPGDPPGSSRGSLAAIER